MSTAARSQFPNYLQTTVLLIRLLPQQLSAVSLKAACKGGWYDFYFT